TSSPTVSSPASEMAYLPVSLPLMLILHRGLSTPLAARVTRSTVRVAHREGARGTAGPPGLVRRPPRPAECSLPRKVSANHGSGEGHRTVLAAAPPRRPLLP